ncbi:hypothetical protein ACHAXT_011581 [Thalassiosira profunda]
MTCPNPRCRHRSKRKLRPLVISLIPSDEGETSVDPGSTSTCRHEQIRRMFATHPSLSAHFEPPVFSPGIPSRELRNRMSLLEHANNAGLLPEVEWQAICRAVREQVSDEIVVDDDYEGSILRLAERRNAASHTSSKGDTHKEIDPFVYLATTTEATGDHGAKNSSQCNAAAVANDKSKEKKTKTWLGHKTSSLVPISPMRRGSAEDRSLPYSMEMWRKAKGLNRDRGVLGCTLAHLIAMKKLVGDNESSSLDGSDAGFDFILEDNVRVFVGVGEGGNAETETWSCECANRIWDVIEASDNAEPECHMRYYGWLGSLPNLTWVYNNHLPRATLNKRAEGECSIFPFPTHDDFELDSIDAKSKAQGESVDGPPAVPEFADPGGVAVWGAFAYTVSPTVYHSLLHQLRHDVGSLMWKGKKMRAYKAKPIDKILPRHVYQEYGTKCVHLPDKVAFVRAPMLGSLLHPHWEEGFCKSTETQYRLSCEDRIDGSDVWDRVWLTEEERRIVEHKKETGEWVPKNGLGNANLRRISDRSTEAWSVEVAVSKAVSLTVLVVMLLSVASVVDQGTALVLPNCALVDAFTFKASKRSHCERFSRPMLFALDDVATAGEERQRAKLDWVPIISRTIPIEIGEGDKQKLEVTVWEMDKPSDLIQEWWSIDEAERSARVGDPFGVVMWPGSISASQELMMRHFASPEMSPVSNATVLVLGAGTGVEAQTAALLGAKRVIATDINPLTLKLLEYGAKCDDRIGDTIDAKFFDLFSDEPLPTCDVLVAADVLYNADLAKQVGRRLHEAIVRSFDEGSPPTKVIITDSQRFHGADFLVEVDELRELNELFAENEWEQLRWERQNLTNVCGSGVLVDEDQCYDVEVRMIRWGWQ